MTLQEFIEAYTGKPIDTDGVYPNQCMDLMHWYVYSVLNLRDLTILSHPSAYQVFTDFEKNIGKQYFIKITNTPDNVPLPGDIIVFGQQVGQYGHVSIFVSGDVNNFKSFDSNWPVGSLPHIQDHKYTEGVLGWLHPIINEAKAPEVVIGEQLKTQTEATNNCLTQLKETTEQNKIIQEQLTKSSELVSNLQIQGKELQSKYEASEGAVIDLKEQMAKINQEDANYAQKALDSEKLANKYKGYMQAVAGEAGVDAAIPDDLLIENILQKISELKKPLPQPVPPSPIDNNSSDSSINIRQLLQDFLDWFIKKNETDITK